MKKFFLRLVILVSVVVLIAVTLFFIYVYPFMKEMQKITTIQYDPRMTVMLGGGGNSGILVSDSAVLVIDTKMSGGADSLYHLVKALTGGKKPVIVVNTHIHTDHTGGNKLFHGQTIIAGGSYDPAFWTAECGKEGTPTVWVKDSLTIRMGEETVTIINLTWNAHTQSDVFVYLHNRKMLFGGDVILNHAAPAMFARYNADGYGYLKAFDYLIQRFDIAKVVPGHGDMGGPEVISAYRDYFTDMKLAALDHSKENELVAKYADYRHIPRLMSSEAVVDWFEKHPKK